MIRVVINPKNVRPTVFGVVVGQTHVYAVIIRQRRLFIPKSDDPASGIELLQRCGRW